MNTTFKSTNSVNSLLPQALRLLISSGMDRELYMLREHNPLIYRHSLRVAHLAGLLGIKMGLKKRDLISLTAGAIVHDIGKLCIPPKILLNQGELSDVEQDILQCHPYFGVELLKSRCNPASLPLVSLLIVYQHHERRNGEGFPDGLRGEQIHLFAQIVGAADTFDQLVYDRANQYLFDLQAALDKFQSYSGSLFTEEIVITMKQLEDSVRFYIRDNNTV